MNAVYFLNKYNKDYDQEAIFINKQIAADQYITYELFNQFGGKVVYNGRAYGEPGTGKINIDITELCAGELKAYKLDEIPYDVLTNLGSQSINFSLTVTVRSTETDAEISKTTDNFRVVLGANVYNLQDTNYIGQDFIDLTYNDSQSNTQTYYEIYRVGAESDILIKRTDAVAILPGQVYAFKYKLTNSNLRIKKFNGLTVVYNKVINLSDRNINAFIYFLNELGNYDVMPVLIDKSMKKRTYTENTYVNHRKTVKYNIEFKDSLDFKTPFLSDRNYARACDFMGSNDVYLDNDGNLDKVNVTLNTFEFKTFKNTKAFNQFTGTIDFMYTNKRFI